MIELLVGISTVLLGVIAYDIHRVKELLYAHHGRLSKLEALAGISEAT